MHSPSMITPAVATEVIAEHARFARSHRETRGLRPYGRILRRRTGGSRPLVPRGRTVPPFAH
jgi:hypothetical protein